MLYLVTTETPTPEVGPEVPEADQVRRKWSVVAETTEEAVEKVEDTLVTQGFAGEEVVYAHPTFRDVWQVDLETTTYKFGG